MRNRKVGFKVMNEASDMQFHCVSRINGRQYLMGDKEKAVFVKIMRQVEGFCGVEVLSYCVMSNHFHLLVRVPQQNDEQVSDEEFGRRLSFLYKEIDAKEVMKQLKKCRNNKAPKMAAELKERYTYRMGNISEFMKTLKQKFSRWYNKANARTGTLWEQRYGVTLVGPGWSTKVVAAYIDLNPIRAGMVSDPTDYRFSSYGEAVAKRNGVARERLLEVMNSCEEGASLGKFKVKNSNEALAEYRVLLSEEGRAEDAEGSPVVGQTVKSRAKKARGFSKQEVEQILKAKGRLSLPQLLRCKARYFTSGFAIGSQLYVDDVLTTLKTKANVFKDRKSGGTKLKHAAGLELMTLRNLQQKSIESSCE